MMAGAVGMVGVMARSTMVPAMLAELGFGLVEAGLGRGVDLSVGRSRRCNLSLGRGSLRNRDAAEARSGKTAEKTHYKRTSIQVFLQ